MQTTDIHPCEARKLQGERGYAGKRRKTRKGKGVKKERQRWPSCGVSCRVGKRDNHLSVEFAEECEWQRNLRLAEDENEATLRGSLVLLGSAACSRSVKPAPTLSCSVCKKFLPRASFSKQQTLKGTARRRCADCINSDPARIKAKKSREATKIRFEKRKQAKERAAVENAGSAKDALLLALTRAKRTRGTHICLPKGSSFKAVRNHILLNEISEALRTIPDYYQITDVRFSGVSAMQRMRFAETFNAHNGRASLVFHGTPSQRCGSILRHGLIVPGSDGPVKVAVANGSAFGVGIYGAHGFSTSITYCRGHPEMFLCGVVTSAGSGYSRHGNVSVITDARLICPLVTLQFNTITPTGRRATCRNFISNFVQELVGDGGASSMSCCDGEGSTVTTPHE